MGEEGRDGRDKTRVSGTERRRTPQRVTQKVLMGDSSEKSVKGLYRKVLYNCGV